VVASVVIYPADPVIEEVLQRIAARADAGIQKFGVTITDAKHPTAYWIDNAIEEAMDLAVYLTKLKRQLSAEASPCQWVCDDVHGHIDLNIPTPCLRCKPL